MRTVWLGPLAAATMGAWAGCGDEVESPIGGTLGTTTAWTTSGTGGATSTTSSAGGGGAGGCTDASSCPGEDTACRRRTCTEGTCGFADTPLGTTIGAQTKGDCRSAVCDGAGAVIDVADELDTPDDGDDCTQDLCQGGVPSHAPEPARTPCAGTSGLFCDGAGACVACLDDADCASGVCAQGACVPAQCNDHVKNGGETDVDCGGPSCNGCLAGEACLVPADCFSGVCTGAVCQPATCTDSVKNGDETGVDCGGACARCAIGGPCLFGGDCQSGICTAGICTAPPSVNGCDWSTATDLTGQSAVGIAFGGALGTVYSPRCIRVKAGTQVTFNGAFTFHPLLAGEVTGGVTVPAASGTTPLPTTAVSGGTTATFAMTPAGAYGYFCTMHALLYGMTGAIYVE
jgi:plastocyanin